METQKTKDNRTFFENNVYARSGPTPDAAGLAREKAISAELDKEMAGFKKRAAERKRLARAKKAGLKKGGQIKRKAGCSKGYGKALRGY